jgi:hypothetical protein
MSFSEQPWSPDGRQLAAFFRIKTETWQRHLVLINAETGELKYLENAADITPRLASTNASASVPIWSPDGRYLLYAINTEEDQYFYQIAIYDLMLEQVVYLSSPMRLINLSGWSYDSQQIAYIRWDEPLTPAESTPLLEVMDVPSQAIQQVEQSPGHYFKQVFWSPTGRQLVAYIGGVDWYESLTTYGYEGIYLIDIENGSFEELKGPGIREDVHDYYSNPDASTYLVNGTPWSPDGQNIIYSDSGLLCSLVIASRQETCFSALNEQLIQLGAVGAGYPQWSPTGEWIGFVMKIENQHCSPVAAVRPDGSDLRFTDLERDCALFGPVWSPARQ